MGRKLCAICETRTVGTGKGDGTETVEQARMMGYCLPCLTDGSWENVHSDYAHDAEDCLVMGYDTPESLAACWICHPELNMAKADHTPRTGHSNTSTHSHNSHSACTHPRTPKARAACRKANTWNGTAWV